MRRVEDFDECLALSKGLSRDDDIDTLKSMIRGAASVDSAPKHLDKLGIDYIVTLRRGATINVDAKYRDTGSGGWRASQRWQATRRWPGGEPELTLEYWSVIPDARFKGVVGWTLDEQKRTDYVLFKWNPADTRECFLLPFQHLRSAFSRYAKRWLDSFKINRHKTARGGRTWESLCVFVPVSVVMAAMNEVSCGRAWSQMAEDLTGNQLDLFKKGQGQ